MHKTVFILEKKTSFVDFFNLVNLLFNCFHPEPKTLDSNLCLVFTTTEPIKSPFLFVAWEDNQNDMAKVISNLLYI